MAKVPYLDKLKDPRWQRKRLELMQSAGFRCQSCGDTEDSLNIHHVYYEKDADPWSYPDNAYMVLCSRCHERWHMLKQTMDQSLCHVDVNHLFHLQSIVTQLSMMGPNTTLMFFDLVSGYHWEQFKKEHSKEDEYEVIVSNSLPF